MPLPLPDLDTRRWSDLVDEGRALLPRYAPEWTDFNVHDPGIMLVELFAWLSEELMYRVNRVPERHLRKFLALCGYPPAPPMPATTVLSVQLPPGSGSLAIPAGVALDVVGGTQTVLPFRTMVANTLFEAQLVALQAFDGSRFRDASRAMRDTLDILLMGPEPVVPSPYAASQSPAMYLGFDRPLPTAGRMQLYLTFVGSRAGEREELLTEEDEHAVLCGAPDESCTPCRTRIEPWCDDADSGSSGGAAPAPTPALPVHHSVRTRWEWLAVDGWHAFDAAAGEVVDDTRSLTLDGGVQLRATGPMLKVPIGAVASPLFWVRCLLVSGAYDEAPQLRAIAFNAVRVEQAREVSSRFVIAPGATITGAPAVGTRAKIGLRIDGAGVIQELTVGAADTVAPELLVLEYLAPSAAIAGSVTLTCARAGSGTGFPNDHVTLGAAPISRGALSLWTIESLATTTRWVSWKAMADLDSASALDASYVADSATGALRFGDGVRGRVPPSGAQVIVSYAGTAGAAGNISAGRAWSITDDALNHAVLGATFTTLSTSVIHNALASSDGADAESIGQAAARAAADLWAHERLVQLCPPATCATLDQLARDSVLECAIPERAATTLDIERIAIEVPGTRVRRARAWSQFDAAVPCAEASGTVTVVLVPALPRAQPQPSAGLRRAIKRWLDRRRVLCTRLVVVGPEYLVVGVTATVTAVSGADPARVQSDIVTALASFLDPLVGGPSGFGWPFGRDVYRSELLALVDGVIGVDHVTSLTMSGNGHEADCSNLCVAPTWLVASGRHVIEVVRP